MEEVTEQEATLKEKGTIENVLDFRKPRWVPDSEVTSCTKCQIYFTILFRKHHCRACGRIFCDECTNKNILLPEPFGYKEPERVCFECYTKYCGFDIDKYYDISGPVAHTIMLVNGALGVRLIYKYQTEAFSAHYRVINTDNPGHGGRYKQKLTKETAVAALREVIEKEVPEKKYYL